MNDEAVAEVIEEEVVDEVESVDAEETEEDTETEETESEETGEVKGKAEPEESSTPKKDDGFQKRIDELTQRYYEEKQQREHFQKQWEESQPKVDLQPGKTLADFDYDEAKFAGYLQQQAQQEAKTQLQRDNQKQQEMKVHSEFQAKEAKFAATVDDYYKLAHHAPITPQVASIIKTAEKGPELAYYLGKNPEMAVSLSNMRPLDAAREIGRIEATKLVKPEPSHREPAKPTPKIKARDTGSARIRTDLPESDKLPMDEWVRRERKRLANRK